MSKLLKVILMAFGVDMVRHVGPQFEIGSSGTSTWVTFNLLFEENNTVKYAMTVTFNEVMGSSIHDSHGELVSGPTLLRKVRTFAPNLERAAKVVAQMHSRL